MKIFVEKYFPSKEIRNFEFNDPQKVHWSVFEETMETCILNCYLHNRWNYRQHRSLYNKLLEKCMRIRYRHFFYSVAGYRKNKLCYYYLIQRLRILWFNIIKKTIINCCHISTHVTQINNRKCYMYSYSLGINYLKRRNLETSRNPRKFRVLRSRSFVLSWWFETQMRT